MNIDDSKEEFYSQRQRRNLINALKDEQIALEQATELIDTFTHLPRFAGYPWFQDIQRLIKKFNDLALDIEQQRYQLEKEHS